MKRRTVLTGSTAITLGAVGLGGISSCGSKDAGSGSAKTSLELWTFLDPNGADDPRGAALKEIVAGFNKQGDGATVTVRSINYAKIDAEVIKATASNNGPDLINIYSNQLPMHVAAKTIQPMTKFVKPVFDKLGKDLLFPAGGVTFDGDIMAMPWETRVWLLWYRADLLKKAGLSTPATLADLGTTGAALQKTGVTGFAIGFSDAGLGADFMEKFVPFTWGNNGQIFDDTGKAVFNSQGGVATMDYLSKLHQQKAFGDEVLRMGADDVVTGIKSSAVAMAIEGSFRVAAARAGNGIGDNLHTAPMPSSSKGTPLPTPVAGQTLGIGAGAKNTEAAWKFIEYYTSEASQAKFAAAGVLPIDAKVYDSDQVKKLPDHDELTKWRDYLAEHGRPNPVSANYNELSQALVSAGQKAVFQGGNPSKLLDQAATDYNDKIQ